MHVDIGAGVDRLPRGVQGVGQAVRGAVARQVGGTAAPQVLAVHQMVVQAGIDQLRRGGRPGVQHMGGDRVRNVAFPAQHVEG